MFGSISLVTYDVYLIHEPISGLALLVAVAVMAVQSAFCILTLNSR